jgi:hypothetical protein
MNKLLKEEQAKAQELAAKDSIETRKMATDLAKSQKEPSVKVEQP